jgi:hypothetical protein
MDPSQVLDHLIVEAERAVPTLQLTLTDEQVLALVKQLPPEQQETLFKFLLTNQWGPWVDLSLYGEERVRLVATQRGRNWDAMTEDERETFIDDLVHEDRPCAG